MKATKRAISLILSMCMIITVLGIQGVAANDRAESTVLKKTQVESYLDSATRTETVIINKAPIKYYFGDDYVIVEEAKGFAKITFNKEMTEFYVNDGPARSITSTFTPANPTTKASASKGYTYFGNKSYTYNVAGLLVSVGLAAITFHLGVGILVSGLAGIVVGQIGDNYFAKINYGLRLNIDEYHGSIDPWNGTVQWKFETYLFHGPTPSCTKYFVKNWVKYQVR